MGSVLVNENGSKVMVERCAKLGLHRLTIDTRSLNRIVGTLFNAKLETLQHNPWYKTNAVMSGMHLSTALFSIHEQCARF